MAMAWAWGVEPMPASLEKRPRLTPWLMAVFRAAPTPPPMMAWGIKAYRKIMPMASGRWGSRMTRSTRPPARYRTAIRGTNFSVTEATRWMPPRKTNAEAAATRIPTIQEGIPKAVAQVEPMELD